jgi:uncharacterized membrane protein YhaH (DUF805 family)
MNLLTRHLTGLIDFQSRENRQPFWLWILIVYIVQFVVMIIAMIPIITTWFDQMMPALQADPHRFDNDPQAMMQLMVPMMRNVITMAVVSATLFFVLSAAAVVRRLHDSNRSGWWSLPYYAMQVISPVFMLSFFPRYFTMMASLQPGSQPDVTNPAFQQATQSMALMSLVNLLGFAVLVMMIVLLVLPGTVGPNRFGDDPLQPPFR